MGPTKEKGGISPRRHFQQRRDMEEKSIQYTANRIKKMDDAIKIVKLLKSKAEDISLGEDLAEEVESVPVISHQNDIEAENFDIDVNADEAEVKDNDFA